MRVRVTANPGLRGFVHVDAVHWDVWYNNQALFYTMIDSFCESTFFREIPSA